MRHWLCTERERAKITEVMKRLYTEQRMSGEEMRDAAHTLYAVLGAMFEEEPSNTDAEG